MATFMLPSEEDQRAEERVLSGDSLDFAACECPWCGVKERGGTGFRTESRPEGTQVEFPCGHRLTGGVAHIYLLRAFPPKLRRLRLPLNNHGTDLLLVGDSFEEGGRYVQLEVHRGESESWSWLDWDNCYDRLAVEWRNMFQS